METTASITINEVGQNTGQSYTGKFLIKTVLSRRDRFTADERRRMILGLNPQAAPPSLQGEALMLGDLSVIIVEAPKWWTDSDNGLNLLDENVIGVLYKACYDKELEYREQIQAQAKTALEKLAGSAKKKANAEA